MPQPELVISAFLAIALIASVLSQWSKRPYTLVLVLLGIILAASSLSPLLGVSLLYDNLVGGGLFVGLVLPPLLFESMMNINYNEFRTVSRPALRLATIGVAISTVAGGLFLWQIARLPLEAAFLFSAIIAPTDVATVLEIFRRVKVPTRLSTLMETEAAFNDATGITIFTIILSSITVSQASFVSATGSFFLVFGGGVAAGLAVAQAANLLSRVITEPIPETVVSIFAVYGSYAIATAVGVSGLVAVAIAGLYYGNTTLGKWVEPAVRESLKNFWTILAFIANTLAFLYIGLSTDFTRIIADAQPIAIAFAAVILARFLSVYPILTLSRVEGQKIPRSWMNVAMLGGMRGALSIALAATLSVSIAGRDLIVSMVLGVAFLSITMQGFFLLRYAGRAFNRKPANVILSSPTTGSST